MGMAAADGAEKFRRLESGHVDVGEKQFDLGAFEDAQGVGRVVGGADVIAFAGEELGEGLEDDAVFVEDEQAGFMGLGVVEGGWGGESFHGDCCVGETWVS